MCGVASSIIGALISAAVSVGTHVSSKNSQKKAEAKRLEAEKEMQRKQLQPKETMAKTAQTPSVNDNLKKRTLSSLKIPTKQSVATVNTGDTSTGLNIPM